MNKSLIILHEEALRSTHPVFTAAPKGTKAIYIWDDAYINQVNYSLKRLVFIYETLCELPIDIIHGDTISTIKELAPPSIYVPTSNNPYICSLINDLKLITEVNVINEEEFAHIKKPISFKRFFQYWNQAEKTAFLNNGGLDA
jgi:hypothetical protein